MRKIVLMVIIFLALMSFATANMAIVGDVVIIHKSSDDVKPIMGQEQLIALIDSVYQATPQSFLLKQLNGPDGRGFRVVFVHHDTRYTLDHNWWTDGIQIWSRPNGTSQTDYNADYAIDKDMDGKAEHEYSKQEGLYHSALDGLQMTLARSQ